MAVKDSKYFDALSQAEAGKTVRDHLKHSDFNDHVISILKNHSGFSSLVVKTLFLSAPFWLWLFSISLFIAVLVFKFPVVAEWICSFIQGNKLPL